jgi:hypothetical protein
MLESKISDVKEEFALALKIFGQDLYFATLTGTMHMETLKRIRY